MTFKVQSYVRRYCLGSILCTLVLETVGGYCFRCVCNYYCLFCDFDDVLGSGYLDGSSTFWYITLEVFHS